MRAIFVFIVLMVNIASPAMADEDSIFEGSKPINIERVLEVSEDLLVANATENVNLINVGDTANITRNIETWTDFKNTTGEDGAYVGAPFEENILRVNDSGAVIVSGLLRAPSDAIMSGASEGWLRIPLNLNINETYKKCALTFNEDYQTPPLPENPWQACSPNLDIRMQIYHIGNPNSYNLTADGYPSLCCKWGSDYNPGWSDMELFDSYFDHSIEPLAHPTKVWDKVYRHSHKDQKCSPEFFMPWAPPGLESVMPQEIADYYGATNPMIPGGCRDATDNSIPLTGDLIRRDIDNRTYLWWSFPWYPDEHYAYIIETNNSMIFPEVYWTTADLGDDGISKSYLKLEDNMHYSLKEEWASLSPATCGVTGYFKTDCDDNLVYNNYTLPVDLGTSVLFTEGHGYGVRGFNITDTATTYNNLGYGQNTQWEYRTPLDGIMFYDRLDRAFDNTKDRLTFTMPFSLPDVTNTNTTDFEERAIVTTCVQGLDDSLMPIDDESWTCNQQVATDHVIISGRDTDVDTASNILYAQNTWGSGICYDHTSAVPAVPNCDEYGDYGIWTSSGGGFEDTAFTPGRQDGDENLHGATYLKYWMSFEFYDPPTIDGGGLVDMSPQCQYSVDFYTISCRGDGTRIWLHDFAGEEMDEDSQLMNSMWVFQGGNLTNAHSTQEAEEGYFDHRHFRQVGSPFPLYTESYTYANNISMWNNSINLKHYNWRPFHTTEISEGTLANINPVQVGQIFEYHVKVIHEGVEYTNCEAYEVVQGIKEGNVMLDSYSFQGSGMPLEFAEDGFCDGKSFKEVYNFVQQTTEQCRALNPSGNGKGGFCEAGMLNWQTRELIELPGLISQEVNLAFMLEILAFIVNRIEENLNSVGQLILFLLPFSIFIVGIAIIWHATRMLTLMIRGELDMALELTDLDRFGIAGITKAFTNLDYLRRRPKE